MYLQSCRSLGCTLIELITGVPPYFEMTSVSACFKMVSEERPPLPQDISKELEDFLICCFRRPVDTRPDARELMSHPWITKHVQSSKTTGDVEQVRRTIKRHTMGKEASKLKQDLKNLDFDAKTFEEAVSTTPERVSNVQILGKEPRPKEKLLLSNLLSIQWKQDAVYSHIQFIMSKSLKHQRVGKKLIISNELGQTLAKHTVQYVYLQETTQTNSICSFSLISPVWHCLLALHASTGVSWIQNLCVNAGKSYKKWWIC